MVTLPRGDLATLSWCPEVRFAKLEGFATQADTGLLIIDKNSSDIPACALTLLRLSVTAVQAFSSIPLAYRTLTYVTKKRLDGE